MPRASSSTAKTKARFSQPHHFSFAEEFKQWHCTVCTNPQIARRDGMSAVAAMKHEKSALHKQRVEDLESWNPQPDANAWLTGNDYDDLFGGQADDQMRHVDSLKDLIPFWQRQVEAANHGVVLRFADFLDALYQDKASVDPWSNRENLWNVQAPAWAVDAPEEAPGRSSATSRVDDFGDDAKWDGSRGNGHEREWGSNDEDIVDRDAFMFVEEVARLKSVSGERKQDMHAFYKVPTDEKLTRIRTLIAALKESS